MTTLVLVRASIWSSGYRGGCLALHRLVQSERQHQHECENDPVQRSHGLYFNPCIYLSVKGTHGVNLEKREDGFLQSMDPAASDRVNDAPEEFRSLPGTLSVEPGARL